MNHSSHKNQLERLLANETDWAADRVERDRNPDPSDPVYFTDPADVPTGLPGMWLLPTVRPDQAATDLATDPSWDAPLSGNILLTRDSV